MEHPFKVMTYLIPPIKAGQLEHGKQQSPRFRLFPRRQNWWL